jgi:hypothetical protein
MSLIRCLLGGCQDSGQIMLSGSGGWVPVGDGTQVSASVLAGKDIHPRLTPVAMILADSSMSRRFSSVMLVRSSFGDGAGFLVIEQA